MSDSPYHELDKLIDEYDEDSRMIKTDKLIMRNYPKVFVMTVASTFECRIKQRCQDFLDYPLLPLNTYTHLYSFIQNCRRNNGIVTDGMFRKFHTVNPNTRLINLDATEFYRLLGGTSFKSDLLALFSAELTTRITVYQSRVDNLVSLLDSGEQYERDYVKYDDILTRLKVCNFATAENSFLSLKLKRNQVAHDFIHGLSDSFNDLSNFYLDAVVYVIALEKALVNITDISAIPTLP